MFRIAIASALMAALLSTTTYAQSGPTVKEVDVSMDVAAIENPEAAAYWTDVASDLENAIVARLTDQIADDGVKISVDISEVELASSFASSLGLGDSRLVGDVTITSETDNTRFEAYQLTIRMDQAVHYIPEGTDVIYLSKETKVPYDAMIKAFADHVVKSL